MVLMKIISNLYPGVPLASLYPNNGIYCESSNDTEFVYNPNSRNVGTISYERDVLERQSLSEVKIGRGSPVCERVRKNIVEYFKNQRSSMSIAKAFQISSSTVHKIFKKIQRNWIHLCA